MGWGHYRILRSILRLHPLFEGWGPVLQLVDSLQRGGGDVGILRRCDVHALYLDVHVHVHDHVELLHSIRWARVLARFVVLVGLMGKGLTVAQPRSHSGSPRSMVVAVQPSREAALWPD